MIKGITTVKSTANTSSCNSFGDSKINIPANTKKVTNMIKQQRIVCEICCLNLNSVLRQPV